MWVKSIELINLKSYKNSKINFSKNVNLLIGANNSGKSTIIKSLLNLQYSTFYKKDIRATEKYSTTFTEITDVFQKDVTLFPKANSKDEKESSEFTVIWRVMDNDNPEENKYYNSTLEASRTDSDRVSLVNNYLEDTVEAKAFKRFPDSEDKNNFIFPFLARRKSDYSDSNINQERTFKVSENFSNLAAKIQKLTNSTHHKNEDFNQYCQDILGFKVGIIPSEQNGTLEVGIYVNGSITIPIKSMGDGVANIVGFIAILLTEDNKLFLIEELENDIHPKALKKLLTLIATKAESNQFIISTHSHIVLKYLGIVPKAKVFYIDWKPSENPQKKEETIPTSSILEIENKPENRIEILEKLGYDFHDFELHEAYLILEESTAERVIRDFLIPHFAPKLYNKLKTIAARGTDDLETRVEDFNRLFVFIHTSEVYFKKAWIIADGEESGIRCINNLKGKYKTWPEGHFSNFSKSDFEYYYPVTFNAKIKTVLAMPHGKHKQKAKADLLDEVMLWAFKNTEDAIKEFKISAKEVIEKLRLIEKSVLRDKNI